MSHARYASEACSAKVRSQNGTHDVVWLGMPAGTSAGDQTTLALRVLGAPHGPRLLELCSAASR